MVSYGSLVGPETAAYTSSPPHLPTHTSSWQVMLIVSWELSWDCLLGHLYVAFPYGLGIPGLPAGIQEEVTQC